MNTTIQQCRLFQYSEEETKLDVARSLEHWHKHLNDEINDFIKFIQTMQKGNLYIGCEYSTYTTDNALMLNAYFNPLFVRGNKYVTTSNRIFTSKLIYLYKNLT